MTQPLSRPLAQSAGGQGGEPQGRPWLRLHATLRQLRPIPDEAPVTTAIFPARSCPEEAPEPARSAWRIAAPLARLAGVFAGVSVDGEALRGSPGSLRGVAERGAGGDGTSPERPRERAAAHLGTPRQEAPREGKCCLESIRHALSFLLPFFFFFSKFQNSVVLRSIRFDQKTGYKVIIGDTWNTRTWQALGRTAAIYACAH